jgi:hypothetical protein
MNFLDFLDLGLKEADQTNKGLIMFFVAHHFLWAYFKNLMILAKTFNWSEQIVQGENI